jgi:hypothetical protein
MLASAVSTMLKVRASVLSTGQQWGDCRDVAGGLQGQGMPVLLLETAVVMRVALWGLHGQGVSVLTLRFTEMTASKSASLIAKKGADLTIPAGNKEPT